MRQGVTSMIFGEGGSAAPVGGKQEVEAGRLDRLQGLLRQVLKQGVSTNIGTYVGSSQIWTYVRGEKAGPPTPAEADADAGSGAAGDAAGRARSRKLAQRPSGIVDRYRHAGRHVQGRLASTAASTRRTCARKAKASSNP